MFRLNIFLCFMLTFEFSSCQTSNNTVISWSLGSLRPFNSSLDFGLSFFSPTKPGTYPLIIFLTGLDGLALGPFYNDFSSQLVEQSQSIIIEFDGLSIIHKQGKEEKMFEKTLNWTIENIDGLFRTDKTPDIIKNLVFPDIKTWGITLMGHSAGSHPPVSYLNGTCGIIKSKKNYFFNSLFYSKKDIHLKKNCIIGLVLLDPVDGYTTTDHKPSDFITHPPIQLPFITPTLIIATGFDSLPLFPHIGAPCAPTNMSNMRFYDSLSGPTWYLNFTSYGHMDIFDDFVNIDDESYFILN